MGLLAVIAALTAIGAPVCPLAGFTGIPCPGCGLTRACLALLRGDFANALHLHPLVVLIAPLLAFGGGVLTLRALGQGELGERVLAQSWKHLSRKVLTPIMLVIGALLFAVWIARFFGAFHGPVEVKTFWQWAEAASFTR